MWKTILIDDEPLARKRLNRLLTAYPEIEVIAEAENGEEGLALIHDLKPDLIFLDIEMPVLNGFEMIRKLNHQPIIVFTTAYDQYAIKAFEEGSVDYLLKPIETERLAKTIAKLPQQSNAVQSPKIEELLANLQGKKTLKTLTVKLGDKILLIKLADIIFIQAEDKYVFLHTSDGKKHLTDFTLSALEQKLPEEFIRIHRGEMINTEYIKEIRKGFNGALIFVLSDAAQTKLSSSRSNSEMLRARFDI